MSNNQGLQVTIFPTHARVPNGLGAFKNVALQDFFNEISRVAAGQEQQTAPKLAFRLPNEALSVRYNQHELELLMYFEEAKREVRYGNGRYTIPFPATVIYVQLKTNGKGGWTVERVKWLCTDYKVDEVPNIANWDFTPRNFNNHLWTLPFPNQYGDGGMCTGANSYRSLYNYDLRGLNELFHTILVASPFNNDLWGNGARGVRMEGNGAGDWFRQLSRLDKFPWHLMSGYPQPTTVNAAAADEEDEDDEEE
jgi:hypothetical protein